jgi:hypothetical protein
MGVPLLIAAAACIGSLAAEVEFQVQHSDADDRATMVAAVRLFRAAAAMLKPIEDRYVAERLADLSQRVTTRHPTQSGRGRRRERGGMRSCRAKIARPEPWPYRGTLERDDLP